VVEAEITLRLKSLENLAVHSNPSEDQSEAAGEFDSWRTGCVIQALRICPNLLYCLSKALKYLLDRIFKQKLKRFEDSLELIRCVGDSIRSLAKHNCTVKLLCVRMRVESESYLTNKVRQHCVGGYLLFATVDFLYKNKQPSQNHGDIVLVLHLECWAENKTNQ